MGGKIKSFYRYLPFLTEISAGGVYFTDNNDPTALCNVVDGSDASGYTGKNYKFPVPGNLNDRCRKGEMSCTWLSCVLLQESYNYSAHSCY